MLEGRDTEDQFDHIELGASALREDTPRASTSLDSLASGPGITILGMIQRAVGDEAFSRLLKAAQIRIFSCVVDTNILVNEARIAANTGTVPYMIELARVGSLRPFASTRVRDEVPRVLLNMASEIGFDPSEPLRAWSLISPWICFLDPAGLPKATPGLLALELIAAGDVPTGQLVELLDPDLLLTADKAVAEFGSSLALDPGSMRTIRVAYRNKAARDALQVGVSVGGTIVLMALVSAVRAIITVLQKPLGRLPKPLVVLILSALATVATHHVLRHRRDHDLGSVGPRSVEPVGLRWLRAFDEKTRAGLKADQELQGIERPRSPARSAGAYAGRVLSRSPGSFTVAWLAKCMQEEGYRPRMRSLQRSVEGRLRSSPRLFICVEGNRWTLRSYPR